MAATHIVVGAGQAGAWAAVAMRQAGLFGGRILLIGEEAWRPYERPPLSKAVLTEDPEPPILYFHPEQRYAELDIELLLGTAVAALEPDAHRVLLADGRALEYDKLLLAVGGQARRLPIHGGDHALYLRTLEDAQAIRARLAGGAARAVHRRRRDRAGDRLLGAGARLRGHRAGGAAARHGPCGVAGGRGVHRGDAPRRRGRTAFRGDRRSAGPRSG